MPVTETTFLPFHRALIEEDDIESVVRVLRSGWLTTGAEARKFETGFAKYVGATNAVALSSCTAALHLALAAIHLREGDEVILPTMTFSSTSEVVLYFKARPVLVDCEPDSFQADPLAIERAITPRTRAIIVVHYAGCPARIESIMDIARRYKLRVIEDAAHALPTRYKGKMVGSFGDITCFSFYATKTLTTGEGGMVTTENPEFANRVRILSLHGISKDAYKRYTAEGSWRYEILDVGYKYNMTDLQAALGLAQLAKCDAMREKRAQIARRYTAALSFADAFEIPGNPADVQHAWHLYVLKVNAGALSISRDQVIEELKQRGIGTSVHFIPLHTHPYYQQHLGYCTGQFPHAERHFDCAISLPLFPGMTDGDTDRVVEALHDVARTYRR
jgi:dTDP-4-amino-4,6-dideoxygalactose transaminase